MTQLLIEDLLKLSTIKAMTTKHPLLDRWVRVLLSINPKGKVPNINTATTANMSVTTLEKMKIADPELYQTVFARPIAEIDDGRLQQHLYDNAFWIDDEEALRANGYEKFANDIRDEKVKFEQEKINKQIEESRARQEETRKRQEAYSNMSLGERMMHEPLSMGQIIDNRMKYHGKV